jgi:TonB family protein
VKVCLLLLLGPVLLAGCATKLINIDGNGVEAAIASHKPELRKCNTKDVQGRVVVGFSIDPQGQVGKASIDQSEVANPLMESCILDVIRAIQFPVPDHGDTIHITYPFRFGA